MEKEISFDIITIFPNSLRAIFAESILGKAKQNDILSINVHNLRDWTSDTRKTIDDRPYGGGPGMVMQIEPIYRALKDLKVYPKRSKDTKVILTSAAGKTWNQSSAELHAQKYARIVIICGHYEGVDYRVAEHLVDEQISIGNYVLTGGELPAAVIVDSISRLVPGVLGNPESLNTESHSPDLLVDSETTDGVNALTKNLLTNTYKEHPHYSRPAEFATDEGEIWKVPEVLLSGDHQKIAEWRSNNQK